MGHFFLKASSPFYFDKTKYLNYIVQSLLLYTETKNPIYHTEYPDRKNYGTFIFCILRISDPQFVSKSTTFLN